ncbi:2-keto-3-deoxygluconate permease [Orenia metallireducens]|jgi:2-keto-3-deoxygluconate permease|uniref:2-keto-3-deoxygluconate permease n=1 Tax=Orenia metallireducens TaxID=1413210 RepID=A0A285G100_9FIRM|nr:2-keto-3-deoxygluconate permease [Orenia metallireducens]PRX31728.1 2-keto-3-deoxygluconate permease [Orenia metallireducens]SNY17023.1 2-keto-3-deoxygluconate permease [Orenia metallireducens]
MNILSNVKKLPGGLMLVPMVIGAVIHTFIPDIVEIGNPMTAIFSKQGTMTVVGIILIFAGIDTNFKSIRKCVKKSGFLIVLKLVLNIVCSLFIIRVLGEGGIYGISSLALVACICSCNAGLYLALMKQYGDEGDLAGFALLNVTGLPFIPVAVLGYAGGNGIDLNSIAATILPFIIGIILGSIDQEIKKFTRPGMEIMLPFLGFCLGSSIDLKIAFQSVGTGIILFIIFTLLNNLPLVLVEKLLLKSSGYVSMGISSVAGLALTVPALLLQSDSSYAVYMERALSQIAMAVVLSAVITPVLVKWRWKNKFIRR